MSLKAGRLSAREMKQKKIGVLWGGLSSEREVSLETGAAVLQALRAKGYRAVGIDVGTEVATRLKSLKIEVAYIALHGRFGEDGVIQGLLEHLRIPYTGSGVLASALGMDKYYGRKIFTAAGLKMARSALVTPNETKQPGYKPPFALPVVVKPVREGSSVGVSIVEQPTQLLPALRKAFRYEPSALVEEYIAGREIQVGVLDNEVLGTIEIIPKYKFYDYRAKYTKGGARHLQPAPLTPAEEKKVCGLGLKAHQALSCEGASRVDFIFNPKRGFFLLEVNTLPGMTAVSLLPEIAAGRGMSFPELVERILLGARLKV